MRVQRLHLLHVLRRHIQPQLGTLFAVERRGDALLHVASRPTGAQGGESSDVARAQRTVRRAGRLRKRHERGVVSRDARLHPRLPIYAPA